MAPSPPTTAPVSEAGDHDDAQAQKVDTRTDTHTQTHDENNHNNLMSGPMSPLTVISESSVSSVSNLSLDSVVSRGPSVSRATSILAAVEASIARDTPPPNVNEGDPGPSTRRSRKRRRSSGSGGASTGGSATPNQSVARRKSLRVPRPAKKAKEETEEDFSCQWPEKIQLEEGRVPTQVGVFFFLGVSGIYVDDSLKFIRCNG